jgi:hypothetical protein
MVLFRSYVPTRRTRYFSDLHAAELLDADAAC